MPPDVPAAPAITAAALSGDFNTARIDFAPSDETATRYVALMTLVGSSTAVEVPLTPKLVTSTHLYALVEPSPPELPIGMYTAQASQDQQFVLRGSCLNPRSIAHVALYSNGNPCHSGRVQLAAYNQNDDRSTLSAASSQFRLGSTTPGVPLSVSPTAPGGNQAWVSFVEPTSDGGAAITR